MPARRPSPPRWYADGLRFECTVCGACCTGAPGYIWVTRAEIARMARHKGLSPEAFEARFVRRVGRRLSLRERRGGDCVMLEGKACSVNASKPTACATFPFWPQYLESPEAWREAARRCEGVDRGDLYPAAEVDEMRRGVAAPMEARQAARRAAQARGEAPPPPAVPEAAWAAAFADLEQVYADLDAEVRRRKFACAASGDCCDFDAFGHRLYATTLEVEWFLRRFGPGRANENPRHCPAWGPDRLCKAREGRMLGCRTFFCAAGPGEEPEGMHERCYLRVKEIHDRHGIPFRYADLTAWAAERRPAARAHGPVGPGRTGGG